MPKFLRWGRGILTCVATPVMVLALAGCLQTAATVAPPPAPAAAKIAAREGVNPRGASVALVAPEANDEASGRFSTMLASAAQARDVVFAPSDSAAYLLRVYLTAVAAPDGVRITAVGDLFDRRKQRAQRLTNDVLVSPRGPNPLVAADDTKLAVLAARSAQDLADTLTNTPEAIAAAAAPARVAAAAPAGTTRVARQAAVVVPLRAGLADAR